MNLRERLQEILPGILPDDESRAMKGTELIERVRAVLGDRYSAQSYRSQFSQMALDPDSCLARVEKGQGYFLKDPSRAREEHSLQGMFASEEEANRAGRDPFRKVLAVVARMQDAAGRGVFVYPADAEASWSHPDMSAVTWPAGYWEEGAYVFLRDEAGNIPPPVFKSVCVAFASDVAENRREFFRALATGLWAQESELVLVGEELSPEEEDELAQLAVIYGVGVLHLVLSARELELLPRADAIFRAPLEEWRLRADALRVRVVAVPRYRAEAERLSAPIDQSEVAIVRDWAGGCCRRGRVEPFEFRVSVS